MAVFRPQGHDEYKTNFRVAKERVRVWTGHTDKRKAQAFEDALQSKKQAEARRLAEITTTQPAEAPRTIAEAIDRWWHDKGEHLEKKRALADANKKLEWLREHAGKLLIAEIVSRTINDLISIRRRDTYERRKGGKRWPVKNGTVNRTMQMLRTVMLHAKLCGSSLSPTPPEWSKLWLKEPKERKRNLTPDEQARLVAATREDYRPIIQFALETGCRLDEIVSLTWRRVDFSTRWIAIKDGAKMDGDDAIEMSDRMAALLRSLKGHHPTQVFTYVAHGKRDKGARGRRQPITYEGLKIMWRRTKKRAGLTDFRFHDLRHSCAGRILAEGGSLMHVKKQLRHASIASVARYAHLEHGSNRAILDRAGAAGEAAAADAAAPIIEHAEIAKIARLPAGKNGRNNV